MGQSRRNQERNEEGVCRWLCVCVYKSMRVCIYVVMRYKCVYLGGVGSAWETLGKNIELLYVYVYGVNSKKEGVGGL